MLGTAIERERGGGGGKAGEGHNCLNCRSPLDGPFCSQCGQKAHVHRSFSAIWHDILHGVLHFDGKFWRTLPLLVFKPGELTHRYIHGERAAFISPMALFLFSIFMMFAVFSFGGGPFSGAEISDGANVEQVQSTLESTTQDLNAEISGIETELAAPRVGTAERARLQKQLDILKSRQQNMELVKDGVPIITGAQSLQDIARENDDNLPQHINTPWPPLTHLLEKGVKKASDNPGLMLYKLKSNGYKFAWLLIPLSLPFIWFATLGVRGRHFYDHAVFVTYSIAFMCLLFLVTSVAVQFGLPDGVATGLFLLVPPVHLYKQLRYSYDLGRVSSFLRLCLLLIFILVILLLFVGILMFLGLLG